MIIQTENELLTLLAWLSEHQDTTLNKRLYVLINNFHDDVVFVLGQQLAYAAQLENELKQANSQVWKKYDVNPENGRRQGYFTANYNL